MSDPVLMPPRQANSQPSRPDDRLQPRISELQFRIEAQQLKAIQLAQGDRIVLLLPPAQGVELLIYQPENRQANLNLLRAAPNQGEMQLRQATQTLAQLQQKRASSLQLQQQLQHYALGVADLQQALCIEPVDSVTFACVEDALIYVLNTGVDMPIDGHDCRNEVRAVVYKQSALTEYLPDALAQPLEEIRVPKASAKAYQVKAGQWIQIIDVCGKQCSDFLAFDAAALAEGQEIALDGVATRSLLGKTTPTPGLHSRFAGSDMQSMLEVVQDTVGRHDMFLNACSPKFYDDSGYFGHLSCTDNFNRVLAEFGIAARAAWPAINFFYNTYVEPCGSISMDEPWSRPGDYVLLRATKDLLCASSACPDDIDPSNGWVPTDIHVRIYDSKEHFPRAHAYRIRPEEMPRMSKTSAFYPRIAALTSHLVEYRGYWVASAYRDWGAKAEYLACRERVALIDLSALRKFEVVGPDAESLLQYALTRNVRTLAIGEIAYSAMCLDSGGMLDDGTIFRMAEQNFRWICGDDYSGLWLQQLAAEMNFQVCIRDSSDQIHNLAVQGPHSRALLAALIWTAEHQAAIDQLAWFHFTIGRLGGPAGIPVMVSRTGYTGELGFEVWCHPEHALTLWDAIWQAGQQYAIAPLGFDALDMLRIEAGLIFAEHEFTAQTNPFEAGIGFTVPLKTKAENFIGKQAIANQNPLSRHKLIGLVLDQHQPALHGDLVYPSAGRHPVGVITSATNSPILHKQIALCRIAPQYADLGTRLEIGKLDGMQKRLGAQVVGLPFYDPQRSRVRA